MSEKSSKKLVRNGQSMNNDDKKRSTEDKNSSKKNVEKKFQKEKVSKLLLALICAPKNKYSPSCGLYASPHLPLGLLAFHP